MPTKSPDITERVSREVPKTPPDLVAALKKSPKAGAAFKAFSASHKREYIEWITEAKRDETRIRRIAQAIVRMSRTNSGT